MTNMTNNNANQSSNRNKIIGYYNNAIGYLVYPSPNQNNVKLPAIVLIYKNREINEHIKESTDILAQQGYVVLAVDLFQGGVAVDQTEQEK